ncbi:MAG: hypothetical protein EBS83_05315 [Planctomycetia bacterium]|nr:hypothetical protein [Planctomycetia bacterium]
MRSGGRLAGLYSSAETARGSSCLERRASPRAGSIRSTASSSIVESGLSSPHQISSRSPDARSLTRAELVADAGMSGSCRFGSAGVGADLRLAPEVVSGDFVAESQLLICAGQTAITLTACCPPRMTEGMSPVTKKPVKTMATTAIRAMKTFASDGGFFEEKICVDTQSRVLTKKVWHPVVVRAVGCRFFGWFSIGLIGRIPPRVIRLYPSEHPMDRQTPSTSLGISAIAVQRPNWELPNDWFGSEMPRKFSRHTGIESPPSVAGRYLAADAARRERPGLAARLVARRLGLGHARTVGLNWFCCGYSRALSLVERRWAPQLRLADDEYILVVVASRISRITDYACAQTAGLFGDMASATLLAPLASRRHPPHFEVLYADARREPIEQPAFDFKQRQDVPVPTPDGGRCHDGSRIVYTLDGMAIAETAPRQMSDAVAQALAIADLPGDAVDFVVPHQAGTGIVRFTGMKLEEHGVRGELINGLTQHVGNVSGCSIPFALRETWKRLGGLIACPTAAVGSPGRPEVLRGCVLLRSTPHHDLQRTQAA